MSDLTDLLTPPAEPDDTMTNNYTNPGEFFNYISPAAWIADVIERVAGVNLFDWAAEVLAGEWGEFHKYGTALVNLGNFLQQYGQQIQEGMIRVDTTWSGNGADAAFNYFTRFAGSLSSQHEALITAGESYHEAARGIWQMTKQLGNVPQAIVDEAIIQGLIVGAEAATAVTGAGLIVTGALAVYQSTRLLTLIAKASKIINTALMVIMGLFGGAMSIVGQGGDLSEVNLPDSAFYLPGY